MPQNGYPIDTSAIKADLKQIAEMDETAMWGVMAAYGEEGERGPVSLCICDDNERGSGVYLSKVIEAFERWYRDTPNEAKWIAEDLRKLADTLDSYTTGATTCNECGELYSNEAVGNCNSCGHANDPEK